MKKLRDFKNDGSITIDAKAKQHKCARCGEPFVYGHSANFGTMRYVPGSTGKLHECVDIVARFDSMARGVIIK